MSPDMPWFRLVAAVTATVCLPIAFVLPLAFRDPVVGLYMLPIAAFGSLILLLGNVRNNAVANLLIAGAMFLMIVLPTVGYLLAAAGVE